jgi:hypothetical protein
MAVMLRNRRTTTGGSLGCAPEQERPVDAKDSDTVRDLVRLQAVGATLIDVIARHPRHRGRRRHPADVEERGENHPGLDRDRQIR